MKQATLLLAIFIAFFLVVPTQADVPFTSEGGFSLVFPGDEQPEVTRRTTPNGKNYPAATVDLGNAAFIVGYSDLEELETDANTVLDKARDGVIRASGGGILSEDSITIEGHPARRISVESASQGMKGDVLLIVRDNQIITVLSYFTAPTYDADISNRFLDSFQLN